LADDAWAAQRRTCVQMLQFWRCLTSQMTHHPAGQISVLRRFPVARPAIELVLS